MPEEIMIVANSKSKDSLRLAKLYLKLRKIPSTHLVEIKVPMENQISREQYNELIAAPLRKKIAALYDKKVRIRCIVTVYGIPLRIGAQRPPDASQVEIKKYQDMIEQKNKEVTELKGKNKNKTEHEKSSEDTISRLQTEIAKLQFELNHLTGADTIAAVDSELALLLSPSYQLAGWQPNPEFLYYRGGTNNSNPVLMVSRLDAPTPEIVEGMMRTSVEVEKTGLHGKFYLDARGFTGKDAYGVFDEYIRNSAEILKKGSMQVILDNRPELFGPGEATSAALYCGWYSLGKYVDAFEWVKGAVGYHVASSEAVSLHDATSTYWVKSMLERGVVASLGPVTEPYLQSFPPPHLFFQLLMSGKYSLAEVFAMTNPFLSWQMILVGDPLYNPFKVNPPYLLKGPPPPPS